MAIQLRRGDYNDLDTSQLLDGELAVVLENDPNTEDGTALYVSFGDDNVRRVATSNDVPEIPVATQSTNGLMPATDKAKLDGIVIGFTAAEIDWVFGEGGGDSTIESDYLVPSGATVEDGYLVLSDATISNGYLEL